MSLIIAKVDKDKRTQEMWSDGIMVSGPGITGNHANKMRLCQYKGHNIIIGTVGDVQFGTYVRTHFVEELERNPINSFDDSDIVVIRLQEIYQNLWNAFCKSYGTKADPDYAATTMVLFDGRILLMEMYDKSVIGALFLVDEEYYAIGLESTGAIAMMLTGKLEPEEIIMAISKVNSMVNSNVKHLESSF